MVSCWSLLVAWSSMAGLEAMKLAVIEREPLVGCRMGLGQGEPLLAIGMQDAPGMVETVVADGGVAPAGGSVGLDPGGGRVRVAHQGDLIGIVAAAAEFVEHLLLAGGQAPP